MGAVTPVAAILPILSAASSINKSLGITDRILGADINKRERQALAQKQRQEEFYFLQRDALDRAAQQEAAQRDESERIKNLRYSIARQRAAFGSQGVGSAGGSSEAVLLGLFQESEEGRAHRERMDAIRNKIADLEVTNKKSTNLLEATRLSEKQRLQSIYDDIGRIRKEVNF